MRKGEDQAIVSGRKANRGKNRKAADGDMKHVIKKGLRGVFWGREERDVGGNKFIGKAKKKGKNRQKGAGRSQANIKG